MLLWALSVWVIYWILLKLTGHSPGLDEINLTISGMIFTMTLMIASLLVKSVIDTSSFNSKVEAHMRQCDRRFYALAKDFKNTDSEFRKHMIAYHEAKYA